MMYREADKDQFLWVLLKEFGFYSDCDEWHSEALEALSRGVAGPVGGFRLPLWRLIVR